MAAGSKCLSWKAELQQASLFVCKASMTYLLPAVRQVGADVALLSFPGKETCFWYFL